MGSPYLNNNENILLSTHNVIINTIPAEAILTNQRLIVVDSRHTRLLPQDIPFSAIETITIGDTSAMEPELSLSIVMKDETRHSLGIIFPQPSKTRRAGERDEWAVKLKEASVAAQKEHDLAPADLLPPWVPGPLPEETLGEGQKNPDEQFRFAPLTPRTPRPVPKRSQRTLIVAVLVIIGIVVLAAAVYLFTPQFSGTTSPITVPGTTAVTTVSTTPVPTTTVPTATIPPVTVASTPVVTTIPPTQTVTITPTIQTDVTQSEVWVRIDYDGSYSASYGTSGRLREATGSGSQYYQIPAKDEIVEATVQKTDDSGSVITVSIYNEGIIAKQGTTTSPHGTVELHVNLRQIATPSTTIPVTTGPAKNATATVNTTAAITT